MITNDVGTNRSQSLESNEPIFNVHAQQQLQQKQIVASLPTNGTLSKVSVTKPIINLVNSSKLTTTTTSGGLSVKKSTVLHLSSLNKTGAPSHTTNSQPSQYSNSQQMTDGIGSLCSIGSAAHKALNRNLSTPILSTTKLSHSNSSSTLNSKYFLTQSSESSQPTSITLTSIQAKKLSTTTAVGLNCTNQPGVKTLSTSSNSTNNNKSNSFKTTHLPSENDSIVIVPNLSLKTSGKSSPPQQKQQQALIDDQTVSSSFSHQNYLQFICSSAAQSPPSSLSSSENCSSSDDSLTMLDDSLTSLQWLQNLNILKSADSAMNNANPTEQNEQQQAESKQGDKNNRSESKTIKIKDEATEFDLDSAVIPAATNQKKLSCLTEIKSIDCSLNSKTTLTASTGQKVEYLTQTSLPAAASKSLSQPKQTKRNGASKQKQAATAKQTANLSNTQFLASTLLGQGTDLSINSINAETLLKEREEFRTNSSVKPPYSYSQLIILAMKESACVKMTLQMIYDWIIENFSYFKKADPSWQITFKNSIRHNLSLNKCFKKIARQKDEPGKGGFWTLDPDYEKQLTTDANKSNSSSLSANTSFSQQLDNPAAVVQETPNNVIAADLVDSKELSLSEKEPKVTKRRRNSTAKVTKTKKNKKDKSIEQSNEFKQSSDNNSNNGKLSVKQPDYGYQYNLPQFSVNQPQILSPTDFKQKFVDNNNNNNQENANSPKKFKSNDMYMPMSHNHNSKITHRTSSPNSSNPLQANSQHPLSNNNHMFYDSNWNNNNQNLINHSLKPINNFNFNNGQHQQNQMVNQDYNFQANNSNYNQQQQTMSQNHTYNSNYINQSGNYGQSNQMTLNMTNFDDSLTGFNNHQSYSSHNQTINPRCINNNLVNNSTSQQQLNTNTSEASGRKFSNQSAGFGCVDSHGVSAQVALPPMPSASAMINTVEDMTGTFSSQFAHEIIKSMDDGNLFSFEENLVCNFDIDQLDETTSDFNNNCLNSSLLNTNNSYNKLQHHQNQQQNHNNNSASNVDEFVNEFLKITSSTRHQLHQQNTLSPSSISNSPPSSASCSSSNNSNNSHFNITNNNNNASSTSAFNTQHTDSELIELFEYTSHFNMDEDTTTSSLSRSSNFINTTDTHNFINTNINNDNNLSIASTALSSPRSNKQLDLTVEGHGITQPKGWMLNDPHHQQIQSMISDLKEVINTTDSNNASINFNNMLPVKSTNCNSFAITTSADQSINDACGGYFMGDLAVVEPGVVNDKFGICEQAGKHAKKRIYTHNKDKTSGPRQKKLNLKLAGEPKIVLPTAAVCKKNRPKKAKVVKSKKVNELILN